MNEFSSKDAEHERLKGMRRSGASAADEVHASFDGDGLDGDARAFADQLGVGEGAADSSAANDFGMSMQKNAIEKKPSRKAATSPVQAYMISTADSVAAMDAWASSTIDQSS